MTTAARRVLPVPSEFLSHRLGGRADPVHLRIDFILSPDCLLKVSVTNTDNGQESDVLLDTRDSPKT